MTDDQPSRGRLGESAPLTFGQEQRLIRAQSRDPAAPGKRENVVQAFLLKRGIKLDSLARAATDLVGRQTALRTAICHDRGWHQRVQPASPVSIDVVDVSPAGNVPTEAEALEIAGELAQAPFDRQSGKLLRVGVIRVDLDREILVVAVDHVVADGWSLEIILRELSTLYDARSAGVAASLPDLPFEFVDYARWQRRRFEGGGFDRVLQFWERTLGGVKWGGGVGLELARPVQNVATRAVDAQMVGLGARTSELLRATVAEQRGTLFTAMVAAVAATVARLAAMPEVPIVAYFANRARSGTENLVGWLATTLFLRVPVNGTQSIRQLFEHAQLVLLDALDNEELPFVALKERLPEAFFLPPTHPTVGVSVLREPSPLGAPDSRLGELEPRPIEIAGHSPNRGRVQVVAWDGSPEIRISAEYEDGRFAPDLMGELVHGVALYSKALALDPERSLEEIWVGQSSADR